MISQQQKKLTPGQKASDLLAKLVRSWYFVGFQALCMFVWISCNVSGVFSFDPYPFDLLKLVILIEAFFVGLIVLMSQNRQLEIDRKIIHHTYLVDWVIKKEVDQILPLIKNDHSKVLEVLSMLKNSKIDIDKTQM